jgi:hypothetical protein
MEQVGLGVQYTQPKHNNSFIIPIPPRASAYT